MTLLAAIGDITRFPTARQLVGYAGMGTRVHDSGQTHHSGRITKAGRQGHPLGDGRGGAPGHAPSPALEGRVRPPGTAPGPQPRRMVAIARKLLDRRLARADGRRARTGMRSRPRSPARSSAWPTRSAWPGCPTVTAPRASRGTQLDRLEIGQDLRQFRNGTKQPKLPKSGLAPDDALAASLPITT